jgi:hypothetical protein
LSLSQFGGLSSQSELPPFRGRGKKGSSLRLQSLNFIIFRRPFWRLHGDMHGQGVRVCDLPGTILLDVHFRAVRLTCSSHSRHRLSILMPLRSFRIVRRESPANKAPHRSYLLLIPAFRVSRFPLRFFEDLSKRYARTRQMFRLFLIA